MKKILRLLLLVAVAIIFGLGIYRWNAKSLLGNELPMPLGVGTAIVLSGSMEDRLSIDDLVIIRKTDTVEVHDIIVYQDRGGLVIHRVIAVDGDMIQTQGDANNAPDDPIVMEDVKGIMVLAIPYIGVVVRFLRHPVVIVLMLGAALLLLEQSFRKDKQKHKDELSELENEIEKLKSEIEDDLE